MLEVETLALDTKFIPDNLELSQIAFREGKSSDIPKNIIGIQTKDSTERFVIENFWYCQLQGALPINKALVISPEDLKKFLDAKGLLW